MDLIAASKPKDRADLFLAASAQQPEISPIIFEKDFWVCWTLKHIFSLNDPQLKLPFKGGTSLSKAFRLIKRFSEDVDLSFDRRQLGFFEETDPEKALSRKKQKKLLDEISTKCKEIIREIFIPAIQKNFSDIIGEKGWDIIIDPVDFQTVLFRYPQGLLSQGTSIPKYIKPAVRLEMGARSDSLPANEYNITPYAAEVLPQAFQNPSCSIYTLEAVRTFWEKSTLLHAEYHRSHIKKPSERISRHYYDLYHLSKSTVRKEAFKKMNILERVVEHKQIYFYSKWAHYDTAKPGSFHILPKEQRIDILRRDYEQMHEMIFGIAPSWDEIMEELLQLENQINELKQSFAQSGD